ncbi:hypothetical protein HY417_00370 [Candidatus Kaiserbacteria bacterium]|nr:hypothetical protein [Candidatus Kaiserbacteria bacterium]
MTKKKRMTIEDLADIIQSDVISKMATKEDLAHSIDELALIIQNDVVSQMATKDDIAQVIERLDGHDRRLNTVDSRLDRIEEHVGDFRVTQGRLVTVLTSKRILTIEETRGLSSA